MAEILIRNIDPTTMELLRRRAKRNGRTLEADVRETLLRCAEEEAELQDHAAPFGTWLVSISRPGVALTEDLKLLRSDFQFVTLDT